MVGNLELIDEPLTAFVRLEEGILMPNALEIPIPVRFIFLLLTPKSDLSIGKYTYVLLRFQKNIINYIIHTMNDDLPLIFRK